MGCGACGLDEGDRFACCSTCAHDIVHDEHATFQGCAHQAAAFAVVFGFFAVIGEGHIFAQARQLHRHCGTQGDAFVGGAKDHVELNAALKQALCVKVGQLPKLGAVVKQTSVEKVRAHAARFGFELAKFEHATIERKLHKCLCQRVVGCRTLTHGKFLVQTHQSQPQRYPFRCSQGR